VINAPAQRTIRGGLLQTSAIWKLKARLFLLNEHPYQEMPFVIALSPVLVPEFAS
jgi:hypothetical protein